MTTRRAQLFVMGVVMLVGQIPRQAVAVSPPMQQSVVIRTVQTADTLPQNGKYDELVEIENTSDTDVDVTGWKLQYVPNVTPYSMMSFMGEVTDGHVFLPAHTRETIFSTTYIANHALSSDGVAKINYKGAFSFSQALDDKGGSVRLMNGDITVDTVRWGSADGITAPNSSQLIRRTAFTGVMQTDFSLVPQGVDTFGFANIYTQADACKNLSGFQYNIPDGYGLDLNGLCMSLDQCPNIEGVQLEVPLGMEVYQGVCEAKFVPADIKLTELLANPSGVDKGNEYLEIANLTDMPVDLGDYHLAVGTKQVLFPDGATVPAHGYLALSDIELGVVFSNSVGAPVTLLARNNIEIDTMPAYVTADIDMAWALIDGVWQYTNRPTPGQMNIVSVDDEVVEAGSGVAPCKPNQYRSADTGRCRTYITAAASTPCKEGQYRSEETGRCRSIVQTVVASLKPCSDDQFRNPETGRCKKIASTEDILAPCDVGWERSPTTNRCHKIKVTDMPTAAFPVQPYTQPTNTTLIWWSLGGVGAAGIMYAAWEWRNELSQLFRRIVHKK